MNRLFAARQVVVVVGDLIVSADLEDAKIVAKPLLRTVGKSVVWGMPKHLASFLVYLDQYTEYIFYVSLVQGVNIKSRNVNVNVYSIIYFYYLDTNYDPCFMSVKTACTNSTSSRQNISLDECRKFCDEDHNCEFIFHTSFSKECFLYQSCNDSKIGDHVGTTYAKHKCPGMV